MKLFLSVFCQLAVMAALFMASGPACGNKSDPSSASDADIASLELAKSCIIGAPVDTSTEESRGLQSSLPPTEEQTRLTLSEPMEECNPRAVKERVTALFDYIKGLLTPQTRPSFHIENNGLRIPVFGEANAAARAKISNGFFTVFREDVVSYLKSEGSPVEKLSIYYLTKDFYKTVMADDLMAITMIMLGCLSDQALTNYILGYYHPTTKVIVLLEQNPGDLDVYTVTHESGHALDNLLSSVYRSPLADVSPTHKLFMSSLYNGVRSHYGAINEGDADQGTFITWYAATNTFEYFAEIISNYFLTVDAGGLPYLLMDKDPIMYLATERFFNSESAGYMNRAAFGAGVFEVAQSFMADDVGQSSLYFNISPVDRAAYIDTFIARSIP